MLWQIGPCDFNLNNLVSVISKSLQGGPSVYSTVKSLTEQVDVSNICQGDIDELANIYMHVECQLT